MSKLTVTLPDDLHAQIRQELEEQGITTGQFIEMVVTKYFTKDKKGENNMATRTIAFQVSEELYSLFSEHQQPHVLMSNPCGAVQATAPYYFAINSNEEMIL